MMAVPPLQRVTLHCNEHGRIVKATLQERISATSYSVDGVNTYSDEVWQDVKPLAIASDGRTIILSSPEISYEAEVQLKGSN